MTNPTSPPPPWRARVGGAAALPRNHGKQVLPPKAQAAVGLQVLLLEVADVGVAQLAAALAEAPLGAPINGPKLVSMKSV